MEMIFKLEFMEMISKLQPNEYGLTIKNPDPKSNPSPIWIAVHLVSGRRITVIFVWGTNQQSERQQSDLLSDSSPIQSGNPGSPQRSPYIDHWISILDLPTHTRVAIESVEMILTARPMEDQTSLSLCSRSFALAKLHHAIPKAHFRMKVRGKH